MLELLQTKGPERLFILDGLFLSKVFVSLTTHRYMISVFYVIGHMGVDVMGLGLMFATQNQLIPTMSLSNIK